MATKKQLLRQLHTYAVKGKVFTFADLRDALGVEADDKKAKNRCWNYFRAVRRDGIVAEVETERDRNKFYKVANRELLEREMGTELSEEANRAAAAEVAVDTTSPELEPAALFSGPDRLTRIEQKLGEIAGALAARDEQNAAIEKKIDALLRIWH